MDVEIETTLVLIKMIENFRDTKAYLRLSSDVRERLHRHKESLYQQLRELRRLNSGDK